MATLGTYYFNGTSFASATSVYTDAALTTLAPDGYYSNGSIIRQQLNGLLLNAQACTTCAVPCGDGVAANISNQNGIFNATVDVANSTGAIIIYGFWGNSIPDGVDIIYNGTHYNRWTAYNNHDTVTLIDGAGTTVDYSGISNQGTGLPTYLGNENANLVADSPYNNTPSGGCTAGDQPQDYVYNNGSGTYVAQGTYQNVTVANSQVGFATDASQPASPVFTAVVPKTGLTPTSIVVDIYAPMCGTAFSWDLNCPEALPSFQASGPKTNTFCSPDTTTYYFARNATGNTLPFTIDTNTTPNVGNFVFEDANGSTYLNDTGTIQYYILGGSTYIAVRNGVVIEVGPCDPT